MASEPGFIVLLMDCYLNRQSGSLTIVGVVDYGD